MNSDPTISLENYQDGWWLNKFQQSPIHLAASSGNNELLQILLSKMEIMKSEIPKILSWGGMDGMKPLHLSVESCHKSCVDLFLRYPFEGMQMIEADGWGRGPVHIAITSQNYSIASKLLKIFGPEQLDRLFGKPALSYLDGKQSEIAWEFLTK